MAFRSTCSLPARNLLSNCGWRLVAFALGMIIWIAPVGAQNPIGSSTVDLGDARFRMHAQLQPNDAPGEPIGDILPRAGANAIVRGIVAPGLTFTAIDEFSGSPNVTRTLSQMLHYIAPLACQMQ